MMNMEDELEKGTESKSVEMTDAQKEKLSEAMSILNSLAEECGCSVEELMENGEKAQPEMEAGEEGEEESAPESEGDEAAEGDKPGASGQKLALIIAKLKAKRQ